LNEIKDTIGGRDEVSLEMHLEAVIEHVWRCTWRPSSIEFEDINLEAMIVRTLRSQSGKFGGTFEGRDRASSELHLEAMIERDWKSTERW